MQREEDGYIIIACDFLGTDWDEHIPMIEGHKGSVLCLDALARAIEEATPAPETVQCTMRLKEVEPTEKVWQNLDKPENANPEAVICWDCIQQADKAALSGKT